MDYEKRFREEIAQLEEFDPVDERCVRDCFRQLNQSDDIGIFFDELNRVADDDILSSTTVVSTYVPFGKQVIFDTDVQTSYADTDLLVQSLVAYAQHAAQIRNRLTGVTL